MKKNLFLVLTFIVLGAASVNAQVTIGSEYDPTPGSILDLQSNGSLGLLLPSVTLTDATVWAPVEGDETGVEGMAVYHNTDDMTNGLSGKGIYVWSNGSWSRMGASATPCVVLEASATQASFVGDVGSGKKLEVVVNQGSAPFNYIWYKDGNPLQTNSNKTEFKDSYLATDYGTYTCEITNGCSRKEI
ncbi:MAG: immunoglobulin domain-containing protein, partial [Candidatus Symbiothrix sp.]|nr:immunoglobulin domain-containing protein [Candidatus Symbiothrix sp.]